MNLPQQAVIFRYCSRIWYEQFFQITMNCIWSARNESHCSFSLLTVFLLKRKEVFYLVSYLYVAVASFDWDSGFPFAWKVEKWWIWSFAIWELNGVASWIWMYMLVNCIDFVTNKTHIFVSWFFKVVEGRELSSQVL